MAGKIASVTALVNGWSTTTDPMGVHRKTILYGNDCLKRAIIVPLPAHNT
jgi:hypothetical protein